MTSYFVLELEIYNTMPIEIAEKLDLNSLSFAEI